MRGYFLVYRQLFLHTVTWLFLSAGTERKGRGREGECVCLFLFLQSHDGFPCGSAGKNPPAMWETWVRPLGWEDPLEKGKASTKQHIVAYELASQEEYNAFPGSLMNGTASFQDAEMQNFLNTS